MAHNHDVYDTGKKFEISGTSRFIKETSATKTVFVKGDHNSEVITFSMPRYIDGHDMMLCNKIRVHYINIETGTNNKSADIYEVTDLKICEDCENEDVLVFTWTVEAPAAKYYGPLSFLVKFECTEGDEITYEWNTAKYVGINVLDGIDNSEEFVDKYSNVLEEWYNDLTKGADSIEELNQQAIAEIELAKEDAKEDIQGKADATMAEMNQFSSNAYNSFKNDVDEKAEEALASIPDDYTTLAEEVSELSEENAELKGDIGDLSAELHEFTETSYSANYFDKTKIKSGYFLNYKGVEVAHNQCFYSEKIPVKAGDIIRFTYSSTTASQAGILYKKDNSFILFNNMSDGFSPKKGGNGDFTYSELVVPENGKFVCINGALGNIDNVMVTINTEFPQYFIPYKIFKKIADDVSVENNVLKLSPLYGKKIYSHGDSIMYGAGDGGKGMLQYIVDDYNMAYTKYAVSGATIAYSDSYNSPKVISRDIVNMSDTAPDYVIIEGGYNDSCHPSAIPLGSIIDGYDSELDDTTFCGALESYLKQIKTKYPSAKIGFVISHKAGFYGGNRWNTKSNGYIPYVRAICEKWSVPYLDMYKDGGFVPSPSNLTVSYTNNSDYVHPTEDGYKLFYYHKLLKFMESL